MYHIKSSSDYLKHCDEADKNPQKFWREIAENFHWFNKGDEVIDCDLEKAKISWFKNYSTNISYNCLDRHLIDGGDKTAIIFEPNDPQDAVQKISYRQLHQRVCQLANFLIDHQIKKGDRVCIYMPMIPESLVAMLACARIGAIHCVVFAGFSAIALKERLKDCEAKILITADYLFRGEKTIDLLSIANQAVKENSDLKSILVYQRLKSLPLKSGSKPLLIWQDEIAKYSFDNSSENISANDPLFILYTSGSTGKPKGIYHGTAGYMVYAGYSFKNVFQYRQEEVFFCTADIGWITGHSYLTYGPLLNHATILMFEGIPTFPTASRFWQIIDKHQVNILYTSPTAIRGLMQKGDQFVEPYNLSSLRVLGSVGEPINEEAWHWYNQKIGKNKCAIVDTWWQTETGGILISSLAGISESKPSFAGLPLPGITPVLIDDNNNEIFANMQSGNLCFKQPWPAMALGVWGDNQKFYNTYYKNFKGKYFSGDGAFRDDSGCYRVIGRIDDVIKVSGHRLGTAEIENAVNSHQNVAESAVISVFHAIKGEGIIVFVVAKTPQKNIIEEIILAIRQQIGAIASPEKIYLVHDLPKTRSGKIMRRILKKIIEKQEDYGDISTITNPEILEQIKKTIFDCKN